MPLLPGWRSALAVSGPWPYSRCFYAQWHSFCGIFAAVPPPPPAASPTRSLLLALPLPVLLMLLMLPLALPLPTATHAPHAPLLTSFAEWVRDCWSRQSKRVVKWGAGLFFAATVGFGVPAVETLLRP